MRSDYTARIAFVPGIASAIPVPDSHNASSLGQFPGDILFHSRTMSTQCFLCLNLRDIFERSDWSPIPGPLAVLEAKLNPAIERHFATHSWYPYTSYLS